MKFQKNKNVLLAVMLVLAFVVLIPGKGYAEDCDMMAIIAKKGNSISWIDSTSTNWDDPYDFFQFLYDCSWNDDGYGIVYYDTYGFLPEIQHPDITGNEPIEFYDISDQAWYVIQAANYYPYNNCSIEDVPAPYNSAKYHITDDDNNVGIVMGHVRTGTGGRGSHPFQLLCDTDGDGEDETYTFEHNGVVGDLMQTFYDRTEQLHPGWFSNYPSNWEGDPNSIADWIDSELYFHYIVANIKAAGGDIIKGIHDALSDPSVNIIGGYDTANFVLSDGFTVYAYRRTTLSGNNYNLEYKEHFNFWSIKTQQDDGIQLEPNDLAIISPYGDIEIINLVDPPIFVYGTISQNTTWNSNVLITDDIIIPEGVTLNIDAEATFISHCTFTINGTVNLQDDSYLKINHSSEVLIENNGLLFLDWGSTITAVTPTTYEATPPGHQTGGEHAIPGDRIIAQNGGIITTGDNQNPGAEITIGSGLPEGDERIWDGILIRNPSADDNYWFVNCDISWIRKLSIENVGLSSKNTASLKLYQTNFHHSGQIVARDGHLLYIHGAEDNMCYIQENSPIPITAYESPVDISYCWVGGIEEDDGLENGGGIYLYDSARENSIINNCNFMYNNSDGVIINNVSVEFYNNNIENNSRFGMVCYDGTFFTDEFPFNNINIKDNGLAEYAGWQNTFRMDNPDADITIEDSDYSYGYDQYLLVDILWDGINPVDISGTNITVSDLPHLIPSDPDAWTLGVDVPVERLMLYSASNDMSNGNYTAAEQTLQQIIVNYPLTQEAGTAVYSLYHLENITDQNFPGLRNYLENISAITDTPLEKAAEKIITKSYMKDKDYIAAIDRLETVINNSQIPDEVIMAMIDQGYYYLKLEESGYKAEPENCTVKTTTLDEYQAKVRELESQFSFYTEEQDQESFPITGNILSLTNFPNPLNPTTTISFDLASESNVSIIVYNIKGQKVTTLTDNHFENGSHTVTWNGTDENYKSVASGLYFYKLSSGKETQVKKMLLLK